MSPKHHPTVQEKASDIALKEADKAYERSFRALGNSGVAWDVWWNVFDEVFNDTLRELNYPSELT